ncbi:phage portal protein [Leptospira interrogans]
MMTATETTAPEKPRVRVPGRSVRMSAGSSSYAAASQFNRDIGLWRPPLKSADAEILRDARLVRARARSLVRDHPYAKQAVRISRLGVVGKKLTLRLKPDYKFLGIEHEEAGRWAREFQRLWELIAHGPRFWIDAGRRMDFTQLMGLVHDLEFVEGEAFIAAEWDQNRPWKSCFQLVDNDRIENPHGAPDTSFLKGGIALDSLSAPLGYHVRNGHPADIGLISIRDNLTWSYVPRETAWGRPVMMHVFDPGRAAQTRGISEFTTVIRAMRMGQEYAETALAAAVLQASYVAVLTSQQNYKEALEVISASSDPTTEASIADLALDHLEAAQAYYENAEVRFNGLKIPHLFPGEDLSLKTPGQNAAGYGEFQGHAIKTYAAGLGTDPISTSQNYSDVNYSSARMSVANNWRNYETRRRRHISHVGLQIVSAVMEEVLHRRILKMPAGLKEHDLYDALPALARGTFITAGAPMLDPVKERQGDKLGWQLGLDTLDELASEEGQDWQELIDQKAEEIAYMRARGVPLPDQPVMPLGGDDEDDDGKSKKPKEQQ